MKKLGLTFLAVLFAFDFCFGQNEDTKSLLASIQNQWSLDDNNNVTYQKVIEIPGLSKDEIYHRGESYFIYNYGSGKSVIQSQDKETGILIAKGLYTNVFHAKEAFVVRYVDTWHIVKIEAKDGKARVTLTLNEYDIKTTDGKGTPTYYNGIKIFTEYPINPDGKTKNSMGKAFYYSHMKAVESMGSIEKALKEGNTAKEGENNNW